MRVPLSILDLAPIARGQTASDSFANSVALAQRAEELGYLRVWYAEHHNMASIASSATSVLIAHVGAQTRTIRLGAGGVMLPNHAPLLIAEQFGTLAAMYPGRIDLGLGRAPGSDQNTMYALRRDPSSADTFPQDVVELQGYLTGNTRVPGVDAVPGKGSNVPLYILGSSLFGASLAAALGLPYAFASHFAPAALEDALALYRREFRPSEQLEKPYAIAGVNVIAADTERAAREQLQAIRRVRAVSLYGRGRRGQNTEDFTDEQADQLLAAGVGAPRGPDAHVRCGRHSGPGERLPRRLHPPYRGRRADRRPPGAGPRGPAAVGHASGRSDAVRPRMTRAAQQSAAIDPTALLGDWRLTRSLADRRAGLTGTVSGRLTLRSEGGPIAWAEQGILLWNGSRLPVSRSYRLLRAEQGWWLYFPDGGPFHPWIPGQWVHHPCREDSYRGLITITGPDQWRTLWEVEGPGKSQRIMTRLSRLSASGREPASPADRRAILASPVSA